MFGFCWFIANLVFIITDKYLWHELIQIFDSEEFTINDTINEIKNSS